jgi:riboflavin-specific deaminase-like protein
MHENHLPDVTVHYAQTLDGRIATRTGRSQWISCDATLNLSHQLRADHDAVLVGVGTILADDPRLTVRRVAGRSPLRIVLDSTLRLPLSAHVLTDGAAPTLLVTTSRAPAPRIEAVQERRAEVLVTDSHDHGRVDLRALLQYLEDRGVSKVLIEGGAEVITSALQHGLVGRLVVCIAPKLIGRGVEAVGNLGILSMSDALRFAESSFTRVGEDIIFDGELARRGVVTVSPR